VAYHPLWLDPALLPGPSILEATGPREVALVSAEPGRTEWRTARREPTDADALRVLGALGLDANAAPVVSMGDAEVLHAFLGRARRGLVTDARASAGLASLYRYLATRSWLPPHLASEYRLRAGRLDPEPSREAESEAFGSSPTSAPEEPPFTTPPPEVSSEAEPAPTPVDAEPLPHESASEASPLPEPETPGEVPAEVASAESAPPPSPPAPEPHVPEDRRAIDEARAALDRERADLETWIRERTEAFEAKERAISERETALEAKAQAVEAQSKAVTERLIAVEKDSARRDVLRFLGSVPGMAEDVADVLATAFPDLKALEAADARALAQCRGVTEALARAIRYRLVPGEVEQEDRAIELREEAQAFMEEGDFAGALACYNALLRERPEDTSLWFDKAEILVLLDRPEEALHCYTRVLDLDRKNRQAWFERANLLFGMGRLADALDSLREGLRADPSKSGDLILKAEELRRDGRTNDAVVLLQAILDVDPSNERAILAYGDSLMDLGDVDAAEGFFTRVLGKDPQNAAILLRRGQLLDRKGRWGAAVQFYNRAIAVHWENVDAWLAKGRTLVAHGRSPDALECFDRALSFDPDRLEAWIGKAEAHLARGEWDEAARAVDEVGSRNTAHPAYLTLRERLARREVRAPEEAAADEALADVEEELGAGPSEGPLPEEFKSFLESVDSGRDDVEAILQLAGLALEGGDPHMALVRYEEALAAEPDHPDAWTGKGVALQNLARYEDALAAYDEALRLDPGHATATRWRESVLRRIQRGKPS
jgi:tetratricopeptide (TPR) repeat protein